MRSAVLSNVLEEDIFDILDAANIDRINNRILYYFRRENIISFSYIPGSWDYVQFFFLIALVTFMRTEILVGVSCLLNKLCENSGK